MLVNFTFKNYKSYLEEQSLDLKASFDDSMKGNISPVSKDLLPQSSGILRTAAVFGALSSGKTNLFRALDYMKRVVLLSASRVQITRQRDSFAFNSEAENLDSHFDAEFIENNTYYRYGFVIRDQAIVREWLFRRTERLTPLFRRDEYGLNIKGMSKNSAKLISPSPMTLFISVAPSLNLEISREVGDVMSWFSKLVVSLEPRREDLLAFEGKEEYLEEASHILQKSDPGIVGLKLIHEGSYIDIEAGHKVYDNNNEAKLLRKIRIYQDEGLISDGSVKLISRLALILRALDTGAPLFINDFALDNPFLSAQLLSLFNSDARNTKGGQLVISTSLSSLVDRAFRRDQLYFTTRDKYCQSHLIRLSSIPGVRKSDSYEKKLLESAFHEE